MSNDAENSEQTRALKALYVIKTCFEEHDQDMEEALQEITQHCKKEFASSLHRGGHCIAYHVAVSTANHVPKNKSRHTQPNRKEIMKELQSRRESYLKQRTEFQSNPSYSRESVRILANRAQRKDIRKEIEKVRKNLDHLDRVHGRFVLVQADCGDHYCGSAVTIIDLGQERIYNQAAGDSKARNTAANSGPVNDAAILETQMPMRGI
ncbi:hypothetical protein P280DRAFT_475606 [Massarina eburnea CBS 473.64]|uniref:Uncharacterized protein n=1 Tax=Massarina eburnea CBS 473.64 TaxID=1395130 RepID=A0A6A6SII6_9PLEO|nr:hypothetical protein P280DRAFT_475606 [Massarina eburnea CBS 473.64]